MMPDKRPNSHTKGMLARDLATHYGFPEATGKDQRIAIVELGGGYHEADLEASFDGLGAAPKVTSHPVEATFRGLPITGQNAPLDTDTIGKVLDALARPGATLTDVAARFHPDEEWQVFLGTLEATLDVAVAGSLANEASIDVYFAPYSSSGLATAIDAAVATKPTVISISWGLSESQWSGGDDDLNVVDTTLARARSLGITVCCSSGDFGSLNEPAGGDGLARVNFPASSPNALACGGTTFRLSAGKVLAEEVWNTPMLGTHVASGGGESGVFARPDYQASLPALPTKGVWRSPRRSVGTPGRLVPDVSALADRAIGYAMTLGGRPFVGHGTSAVAPLWAALLARISERSGKRVGWINSVLYRGGGRGFLDITEGNNQMPGAETWFSAASGWDACTGWGAPDGAALEKLLTEVSPAG